MLRSAPTTQSPVLLTAGDAEVTVLPADGCRLGSLRLGGTELLRAPRADAEHDAAEHDTVEHDAVEHDAAEHAAAAQSSDASEVFGYGSFAMVPWAGRVDRGRWRNGQVSHQLPIDMPPHAIHGTGIRTAWSPASAPTTASAAFYYDLADPWPYAGRVTQLFELTPDSLRITLSVETAADSFPAQVGWHPWFRKRLRPDGPEARLDFAPAWQEQRGEDYLPTGRRIAPLPGPRDDCFGLPDGVAATLVWEGELSLELTADVDWLVVYDEQRDAICVEPQSGPPNGLNTAPRLVTRVDPLEASTTWTWHRS